MDTNAFFLPFQFNINLDSELERVVGSYDFIVPSSVVSELEGLLKGNEPRAREAMSLYCHLSPEVVEVTGPADEAVIALAGEMKGAVLTQDAAVRRKAMSAGVPLIFLRGGKHLVVQRPEPF